MAHLIDKDVLVAQASIEITSCRLAAQEGILTEFGKGKLEGLEGIVDFLNILEVKEVDLEKEIEDVKHNYKVDDNRHTSICSADIEWLANHFFELGLRAQKGE